MSIVLATFNSKKAEELNRLLSPLGKTIVPFSNFAKEGAEETACTFVENALLKARFASEKSKLAAIADDSGLVVPALGGVPGVFSARYAGVQATDADNRKKLLEAMTHLTGPQREAFFVCVLVFLQSATDPLPLIIQGIWKGSIAEKEMGHHGFGYDPIFWVNSHQCTSAQMDPTLKDSISHRGSAMQQLLNEMQKNHVR